MLRPVVTVLSSLSLAACSVFGVRSGTEEPAYSVLGHVGAVELRAYGGRLAAETSVSGGEIDARSKGFQRLAGYIFGANRSKTSIAMTAPVGQTSTSIAMTAPVAQNHDASGGWTIRFFMPVKYTMNTLPTPDDAQVRLVSVPPTDYAVLRFTGSIDAPTIAREKSALSAVLVGSGYSAAGSAVAWFYDPPWTIPLLRRNEVAVPVSRANKPADR